MKIKIVLMMLLTVLSVAPVNAHDTCTIVDLTERWTANSIDMPDGKLTTYLFRFREKSQNGDSFTCNIQFIPDEIEPILNANFITKSEDGRIKVREDLFANKCGEVMKLLPDEELRQAWFATQTQA